MKSLIQRIKQKEDIEKISKLIVAKPELLSELVETMANDKTSLKFGCEKVIRTVSEKRPELVYLYFDSFVRLLDSENRFLKWGATLTIANLAAVDSQNKFEEIFDKYYALVAGKEMVAGANVVGSSWKIALAKFKLVPIITERIMGVQNARYEHKSRSSPECKNVVLGQAIDSLAKFYDMIENKEPVLAFVKKQLNNTRPQVVKKAEKFLKQIAAKQEIKRRSWSGQ